MKKMTMMFSSILLVLALSGSALAVGTFVQLPFGQSFFPGQISTNYDGSVLGGNWGGVFFYTADGGQEIIDDGAHGYLSFWDITGDGTTLSLSFANENGEDQAGYFNHDEGFVLIPSTPNGEPCGGLSSGYGLNFDGTKGTGLQWIAGCEARAYRWTKGVSTEDLGSSGGSSRGTGISGDGSVIVGFDEHPSFGFRRAAIWTEDVEGPQLITPVDDASECYAASYDGSKICGVWNNNAMYWDSNVGPVDLGTLPGDEPYGSIGLDISDDGKVVGFSGNPFFSSPRGFIWTPEDGLMLFTDYMTQMGVDFPEGLVVYSVMSVSGDGNTFTGAYVNAVGFVEPFVVYIDETVGIERPSDDEIEIDNTPAVKTTLQGAYPNPFNPMTTVKFSLERDQNVRLSVFDMSGRLVTELANESFTSGEHSLVWQGRDSSGRSVSSGNYILQMVTDEGVQSSKMSLVR